MKRVAPALTAPRRSRLLAAGRAAFVGFELETVARTASTQDRVRARARRGAPAGWCCVAGEQTRGRGRQGRSWSAPPGSSLLTSLLLRPAPEALAVIPLLAGVATAEALARTAGLAVGLKWPNDVVVNGAKLAGLLAEVEPATSGPAAVVLGMGMNLQVDSFPEGARGISLHRAVSAPPLWDDLLGAWLGSLSAWLALVEAQGRGVLLEAWRRRAVGLGATVEAITPQGPIRGVAADVDRDGALIISTAAGTTRLLAGDVHLTDQPSGRGST